MSSSVTPQRRQRDVSDFEDDEELYGSTPKRQRRLDDEAEDDREDEEQEEGSQSSDGSLLPDSFRRSPKGKGRAHPAGKHQPGSIVRVRLHNFVTYTDAEFSPGPNLNMIIGPNGTGKSTLVCAMCLGLGWDPKHLGRAKLIGEFVKHGAKKAEIEIELAADPERHASNPVVTTRITKEGKQQKQQTEFLIDGKKVSKKEVERLMRSFSIQVDNLCQFLPQDRVVEFAALSPIELLAQTQRAAAPPQMCEWHDQLKVMRKEQKTKLDQQQALIDELKNKEDRQNQQHEQVERLKERSELQDRVAALDKLRPFPDYLVAKAKYSEARHRLKEGKTDLVRLQRQVEPNLVAEREKESYLKKTEAVVGKCGNLVDKSEKHATAIHNSITAKQEKIQDCEKAVELEKKNAHAAKQSMPKLRQNKADIERHMRNPPADVDLADYNERLRGKTRDIRAADDRQLEIRSEIGSLGQHITDRQRVIDRAEAEQGSMHTQAGQQANKLRLASRDAHTAWEWIQRNPNRFRSEVFGPPIVSCSVTEPRNASAVESALGNGEMVAFTATNKEDYQTLSKVLYDDLRLDSINLRLSEQPLAASKPPASREQLRSLGLEAWILDLVDGPEPVLAMLCDNRNIHATAFTGRELNNARLDALKASNSPITSWVTQSETYRVARRREYGEKATSVQATGLRQAKYFTDAPASHNEDAELEGRVADAKRALAEYEAQKRQLMEEFNDLKQRRVEFQRVQKEIQDEKNRKQSEKATFDALPTKLEGIERKLAEAQENIDSSAAKQREIANRGDKLTLEKGQLAIDYAIAVNSLRDLLVQHMEAQIRAIEAQSDLQKLKQRTAEEKRLLEECGRAVERLEAEKGEALGRGEELGAVCHQLGDEMNKLEHAVYEEIKDKEWSPEQLETEIQSVQARLDMTDGAGNQHVLRDYEERARRIEQLKAKRESVEEVLEQLEAEIREIREQWEPRLDDLIAQISEAFAENFSKIQCAGEVAVHKDEDFELWAIQIKVKFRENEPLTPLDAHRQSGGERAVSTIFYLLALQSLARAPFRVVDEINQGMDPRNERLVHSRMVEIASPENGGTGGSQYFLITPKLLQGLRYGGRMKVHCIVSGEYMPGDWRGLEFGMLAKRAVEVRRGVVAAAAAG